MSDDNFDSEVSDCTDCGGDGYFECDYCHGDGCHECDGIGTEECSYCSGTGIAPDPDDDWYLG